MGNWGYGIRQDDFVLDVIGVFEDLLKSGKNIADATKAAMSQFAAEIKDADDGPLFWIAIADVQWTYGKLEQEVLQRVKHDYDSRKSLSHWTENEHGFKGRCAALDKFITKISGPNTRPKKPTKIVIRAPKFRSGDCLAVHLADGQYVAALVLAADHSNLEYGTNLIVVLDYLSPEKPTMQVFRNRKWLFLNHNNWKNHMDIAWYLHVGFRAIRHSIEIIGQIEILDSDPKESDAYAGWNGIGEQVRLQRDWDAKNI